MRVGPPPIDRLSEYKLIQSVYKDKFARRSKLPYMRHIDQGARVLEWLTSDHCVFRAWCVHPIFQMDDLFMRHLEEMEVCWLDNPRVAILAMEYRHVANAFLSKDTYQRDPKISILNDVNTMLIADKIQNWYDAERYVLPHVDRDEGYRLRVYFSKWRQALGVSDDQQKALEELITEWWDA